MKFNSILFAVFVLLIGCENAEDKTDFDTAPEDPPDLSNTAPEKDPLESAVEWTKLQDRNGDAYIPNTDKPYSGWAKKTFENGQVEILVEFTDGSVTRIKQWQKNGIPKWDVGVIGFKGEKLPIEDEDYWTDIPNESKNGKEIIWHENGQMSSSINYKNGKADGELKKWYKNGQMFHKVNFTNGKKDGTENGWYENGQKMVTLDFNNGKVFDGQVWLANGENCKQTNLKKGNGKVFFYDDNNTLHQEQNFISGDITKLVRFYSTGEKSFICNFQNGLENGTETHFYRNGKVKEKGINKNGEREGLWTEWYDDGTKESEINYQNGELHGLWTQWREDGTKWWVSTYKLGEQIGDTKFY